MSDTDPEALLTAARDTLANAHAPYSQFPVAAAVLDDRGRVFTGANVENASYGLTMCAERVAIFTAIASGARGIRAIAVTARRVPAITPCGACRQVMAEFCEADTPIYSDTAGGAIATWTAGALLPNAFEASSLAEAREHPRPA